MSELKIGCICVTENRSKLIKIALLNYKNQNYENKLLLVGIKPGDYFKYLRIVKSVSPILLNFVMSFRGRKKNVTERIDELCLEAFDAYCDVVTFFDDDDWFPYDRLKLTAEIFDKYDINVPLIASYNDGWFCNLRTLRAEHIECKNWPLWGGCLAFNRAAYELVGGFSQFGCPGYDRGFMARVPNIEIINSKIKPVAFSHGKNVATWLKDKGEPFEDFLIENMKQDEFANIKEIQSFLIERRIFPPNS